MKKIALAALAAAALVCLPLLLHAQTTSTTDVGAAIGTAVDAGRAHDWQVALAAMLGLAAWALRRFAQPAHVFHTPAGFMGITAACTAIGALVPVLQAHAFTLAALVGAITSGVTAALALSNPSSRPTDNTPPPPPATTRPAAAALLLLVGLGLALAGPGCADPIRQGATATLRVATAAVQTFEQFDHQHKRDLSAAVVQACTAVAVGADRDTCVEREAAPLRDYLAARKPVIDALDGMEVSAGMVHALVDLDGPAPPQLGALAQTLGDIVVKVVALFEKLRAGGAGGVR